MCLRPNKRFSSSGQIFQGLSSRLAHLICPCRRRSFHCVYFCDFAHTFVDFRRIPESNFFTLSPSSIQARAYNRASPISSMKIRSTRLYSGLNIEPEIIAQKSNGSHNANATISIPLLVSSYVLGNYFVFYILPILQQPEP